MQSNEVAFEGLGRTLSALEDLDTVALRLLTLWQLRQTARRLRR